MIYSFISTGDIDIDTVGEKSVASACNTFTVGNPAALP